VGSDEAALFGCEDGGLTCSLFAATHPARTRALILYAMSAGPHEGGWTDEMWDEYLLSVARDWGTRSFALEDMRGAAPSYADDLQFWEWYVAYLQLAASPAAAEALLRIWRDTDIRPVLPSIQTPTLVVHRVDDEWSSKESAQIVARLIPNALLVEPPGRDTMWFIGDIDALIGEIQKFLTGARAAPARDRVLATVLFTDIVDSTSRAAKLGDARWKELLGKHHDAVRAELQRFGGREIDTAGDGFLATFDGPARAVRCASAIADAVRILGIEIRAGVHTGEVEVQGSDLSGIAVHIGARVSALAEPGEVLVSSTVKDLVAGSASFSRRPASTS